MARLVGYPSGRVAADGSSERTDDGRVVRDFKFLRSDYTFYEIVIPRDFSTEFQIFFPF